MPFDTDIDTSDSASSTAVAAPPPHRRSRRWAVPEFPGCERLRIGREAIEDYEERLEFWDADTETAWRVCDVSPWHELPSQRLSGLVRTITVVRGLPIVCFGAGSLELQDERGERQRILQADQTIYLYPRSPRMLKDDERSIVVGRNDLPDVVVEVDHSTDVRRGKLWLYEEWGFPEVWVEVPERRAASRPAGRQAGLTIHLLEDGEYRTADESRAFPGWTAAEIHAAMNELEPSADTEEALVRVGLALGERDGTSPGDSPWLRRQRRESRARGRSQGRAEGRAELLDAILPRLLASRELSRAGLLREALQWVRAARNAGMTEEKVIDAVLQCKDEADLRTRLQQRPSRR